MHSPADNAIQVLVVDDSAVIRGLISRKLGEMEDMHVVSTAVNGRDAISQLERFSHVEVVVLDIEMPEMDGLTALPELLKVMPDVKILMASTLTQRNATVSMDALALGASDYVPKPSLQEREALSGFYDELILKVRALGQTTKQKRGTKVVQPVVDGLSKPAAAPAVVPVQNVEPRLVDYPILPPKAIAIASSTGGPQALNELFRHLDGAYMDIPIFITQHMPPTFTTLLAKNIGKEGNRLVKEGEDGEVVKAGVTYVAPGDYHMRMVQEGGDVKVRLAQDEQINFCRPAADPMIDSLSEVYAERLLIVVLTGMGVDGRDASKRAAKKGAAVLAQDEETSVVWGMPGAVAQEHICSAILPPPELAQYMIKLGRK